MAERKYQFEPLTPTDNVDLDVYEDAYYYYRLADTFYSTGKIEKAIELFKKSLELEHHFKTYEKLYYCYKSLNQDSLADYYIKKAYEENSSNDKTAYLYAKTLMEKNKRQEAKKLFFNILKRNPTYKKAKIEYDNLNI